MFMWVKSINVYHIQNYNKFQKYLTTHLKVTKSITCNINNTFLKKLLKKM